MILRYLAMLAPLLAQEPAPHPPGEHSHGDDFQSMLAHRAFADVMRWKEAHPWRVGTEVRKFLVRMEEARGQGNSVEDARWNAEAAFLAEALADEVLSALLIEVMSWDAEARGRFDTARSGLSALAGEVAAGRAKAVVEEIDALRPPVSPPWTFEVCASEILAIAKAEWSAGDPDAARMFARETLAISERTRDGEVAAACAALLGVAIWETGDLRAAVEPFERAIGIARDLEEIPDGFETTLQAAGACAEAIREHGLLARAEAFRAELEARQDDAKQALESWSRSVVAMEALRKRGVPPAPTPKDPYREAVLCAARLGNTDEAWRLAEIFRARELSALGAPSDDPTVARARRELQERESKLREAPEQKHVERSERALAAEKELDAALADAEAKDPRRAILFGRGTRSFEPPQTQARLAASGIDSVVAYVVGEDDTAALTMTAGGRAARMLPVGSSRLRKLVGTDALGELHAGLVEPIAASIGSRIAVVPDIGLERAPLEELFTEDGAVVLLPCAAVLGAAPPAGRVLGTTVVARNVPPDLLEEIGKLGSLRVVEESTGIVPLEVARDLLADGAGEVVVAPGSADDIAVVRELKAFAQHLAAGRSPIDAFRAARRSAGWSLWLGR